MNVLSPLYMDIVNPLFEYILVIKSILSMHSVFPVPVHARVVNFFIFLILCEGMWLHLHGKTIVICAKKLFCCIWFFYTTLRVNRIKPVWTKFKFIGYIKWDFIYYTFKYCSISIWCSSFVWGCCDSFFTIHIADFFAIEIEYRENSFLFNFPATILFENFMN